MKPAALKALMNKDLENFVIASTPGGIEAQEKRGQIEQSFLETLPIEGTIADRYGDQGGQRKIFESLGFIFGDKADDLFVNVKFPEGWRKQPTDHSMWSNLLDPKGRVRGMIFYKAAFYDRSAHISIDRRFSLSPYENGSDEQHRAVVLRDAGKTVKTFGEYKLGEYAACDDLLNQARTWLKTEYPDHENPIAYWD